jgi:hypothetical protein
MFPLILVVGGVYASLGAVKIAVEVVIAAEVLFMKMKNIEAAKNNRIDFNPLLHRDDSWILVDIPPGSIPGLPPELEGEWLMLKTEQGRLDKALELRLEGVESEDLKRLCWARHGRVVEPETKLAAAKIRLDVQKPRG